MLVRSVERRAKLVGIRQRLAPSLRQVCPWCDGFMDDDHYCPSPDEIQEACRRIRAAWSPDERQARRFAPVQLTVA